MNDLVVSTATFPVPALVAAAGDQASVRFLEFFAANIRNPQYPACLCAGGGRLSLLV